MLLQVLPDQQHCYFLNGDAPVQDGRSLQGALVSKIPFRHPAQVPLLLDIIRHQAACNNLIGSCVRRTTIKEGQCLSSGLLYLVNQQHGFCHYSNYCICCCSLRHCRPAAVWSMSSHRFKFQRLFPASRQWVISLWWALTFTKSQLSIMLLLLKLYPWMMVILQCVNCGMCCSIDLLLVWVLCPIWPFSFSGNGGDWLQTGILQAL